MFLGRSGSVIGDAFIEVLNLRWTSKEEPYIPLKYHFSLGKGNSINDNSALVKPFRKLLNDGEPIGKIAFIFYRDQGSEFVLGSFAFTNRVIFFSGIDVL